MVYSQYGPPEMLSLQEVPTPSPKDDEVLVKVQAASVNSWDWDLLQGTYINRLIFGGFSKPKLRILGADIAGQVEAVGQHVTQWKPGDAVFGDLCQGSWGGFAEYVCARENALARKPIDMTYAQAASFPQAGVMALQSVRDKGKVQAGQQVLINGGGVGTFAIQMAKAYGAEVTGVDRAEKFDMMRSIGADHVIDYTREDFTAVPNSRNKQGYDLIIDVVANRTIFDYQRALSPQGIFVMVGGTMGSLAQAGFIGPLISMTGRKKLGILAHEPNKDLAALIALFAAGKVIPVIDKPYPLEETAEALRHLGEGYSQGKVVITMGEDR